LLKELFSGHKPKKVQVSQSYLYIIKIEAIGIFVGKDTKIMAGKIKVIAEVAGAVGAILSDEKVQKRILGEYSDGRIRSIPDAINDEILSPKQKQKKLYKKKKSGKKKVKLY
jgi:hypothetical protein